MVGTVNRPLPICTNSSLPTRKLQIPQTNMINKSALDLSTIEGAQAYLTDTPFASTEILPLSGGSANFVFRLTLEKPYEGHTTLILKHAKPYAKDWPEFVLPENRQTYEVEALRRVRALIPAEAIATVPQVHLVDEPMCAIIMDDSGPSSMTLKEFMKQGKPSLEMAAQIGDAIGEFLGTVHRWGKGNREVCNFFEGNAGAKTLSAWMYYGRLVDTLTLKGLDVPPMLCDPPIEVSKADLEILHEVADETEKAIIGARDTFVMGDFWPGNMMVMLDEKTGKLKRIYVVDWEITRPGLLGMEVGQFCVEMHLLRRSYEAVCQETASLVLGNFMERYKKICAPDNDECKRAIVQWGAHMAVWGPRTPWGGKELTRQIVLEGVDLIVKAYKGGDPWLKESFVGAMLAE